MQVIGYLRVSTSEQGKTGVGLEAQRKTISDIARLKGWEVTWYTDISSGKSLENRHFLPLALDQLKKKQAKALVVAKLDRLSRSVKDFAGLLELSRQQGWGLVALDIDIDTTSPEGKMMAHIFASYAQFERERIGQRTKEGMAVVKARGPAPGKKAIGRPRLIVPAVEGRIRRLRTRGHSLRHIATFLNQHGISAPTGGPWAHTTIDRVLRRTGTFS